MTLAVASTRSRGFSPALLGAAVPLACLLWAYGNTLVEMAQAWNTHAEYSHGYLVPGFAAVLLWLRRDRLDVAALRPSWWGLPVLAAGLALRLAGTFYYFVFLDALSLLPCLAGLVLLAGGRAAWRWTWPGLLFLAFMIPLPFSVATALSGPLQRLATVVSTFLLQTFGLPALAEGNVILINDASIAIVEACSGLRMLVVFIALSTAVALVIRRPLTDKLIVLASAIPIALTSNVVRITATGVLHETVGGEKANAFFHDVGGWLMMPLGLALLGAELWLMSRLFLTAPAKPERLASRPSMVPVRQVRTPWKQKPAAPVPAESSLPPVTAEPAAES
jgi:exosortase